MYKILLILGLLPVSLTTLSNLSRVVGGSREVEKNPADQAAVPKPEALKDAADKLADQVTRFVAAAHSLDEPLALKPLNWQAEEGDPLQRFERRWIAMSAACELAAQSGKLTEPASAPVQREATTQNLREWQNYSAAVREREASLTQFIALRDKVKKEGGVQADLLFEKASDTLKLVSDHRLQAEETVVSLRSRLTAQEKDQAARAEIRKLFDTGRFDESAERLKALTEKTSDDEALQMRIDLRRSAEKLQFEVTEKRMEKTSHEEGWRKLAKELEDWLKVWEKKVFEADDKAVVGSCRKLRDDALRETALASLPAIERVGAWLLKAKAVSEEFPEDIVIRRRLAVKFREMTQQRTLPTSEPDTKLQEALIKDEGYRRGVFEVEKDQIKYWPTAEARLLTKPAPTLIAAARVLRMPHRPQPLVWAEENVQNREALLNELGSTEAWKAYWSKCETMQQEITTYRSQAGITKLELAREIQFAEYIHRSWETLAIGEYAGR